jgi:hypothetical protein
MSEYFFSQKQSEVGFNRWVRAIFIEVGSQPDRRQLLNLHQVHPALLLRRVLRHQNRILGSQHYCK